MISAKVLIKTKETAKVFLGKKVTQAIATVSKHFNDAQRQAWNKSESPHRRKRTGIEVKETREKVKVKTIQWVTGQYQVANDLTKKEDTDVEKTQVEVCKTNVHRHHKKFPNALPIQTKEQKCHFKPKTSEHETKTQPEMKTHPIKAKKYSYAEVCKGQSRETYNHGDIRR